MIQAKTNYGARSWCEGFGAVAVPVSLCRLQVIAEHSCPAPTPATGTGADLGRARHTDQRVTQRKANARLQDWVATRGYSYITRRAEKGKRKITIF